MRPSIAALVLCVACSAPPPPEPMPDSGLGQPMDAGDGDAGADAGPTPDAGSPGCGDGIAPADGLVLTTGGALQGQKSGEVYRWLGVPYVQPPVGALRWRAPQPLSCASGVRAASAFGPSCMQQSPDGGIVGAEDCLTLNVWSKSVAGASPVLVFVHGGGNSEGGTGMPLYDGASLASRYGVVVVTINYRLGALGYFVHTGLNAESDAGVSGNYGILDQQAALRWVRDNAAAFGGDPTHVLLFGESAGGQDTFEHVIAPGSKGLFTAAIVESGGFYRTSLTDMLLQVQPVIAAAGCGSAADVVACLRAAPPEVLVGVPYVVGPLDKGLRWGPVIDGVVIPAYGPDVIKAGQHNAVPIIVGTNANETSRMVPRVSNDTEYQAAVRAQLGMALGNQVLMQYPSSRFSSPQQALVAVTTDQVWTCNARRFVRALAAHQSEPVFRYFFSWHSAGVVGAAIGATHGLELPFVFGTFSAENFTPGPAETALSDAMGGYWTGLVMTGQAWTPFPASGVETALQLDATIAPTSDIRESDCDFWDSLIP